MSRVGTTASHSNKRVRVVVRPKPLLSERERSALKPSQHEFEGSSDPNSVFIDDRDSSIRVGIKRDLRHANGKDDPGRDIWTFKFDQVLDQNCSQQDVFDACMQDILDNAMIGFNGTILAYGQTGAGKTYTMTGKQQTLSERGLAARTVSTLFKEIEKRAETSSYTIRMSYLEIYNEQLFDLLDNTNGGEPGKKELKGSMQIHSDETGNMTVNGLSRRVIGNEEEGFSCLFEGETNRVIGSHELNYSSTRSHCILTFYIEGKHKIYDESVGAFTETLNSAKLNLVDLAGSERIFKTNSTGVVLEEAKSINKSLSFLEQVVVALGEKQREHIPYRQSQLTHFLKDSLGGNCKTLLIACVWPSLSHTEQTLATLKFATRMMRVKNEPTRNDQTTPDSAILLEYKKEVAQLRAELALRDTIAAHTHPEVDVHPLHVQSTPYSQDQLDSIAQDIEAFLSTGDRKYVKFHSVRQIYAMFDTFRSVVLAERQAAAVKIKIQQQQDKLLCQQQRLNNNNNHHVQKQENQSDSDDIERKNEECTALGTTTTKIAPASTPDHTTTIDPVEKENLFKQFKTTHEFGKIYHMSLQEAKQSLLELKNQSKQIRQNINNAKRDIDSITEHLEQADEESKPTILQNLKQAKREYKQAMESLKEIKSETAFSAQAVKSCRERLASEFNTWVLQQQ